MVYSEYGSTDNLDIALFEVKHQCYKIGTPGWKEFHQVRDESKQEKQNHAAVWGC